MMLSKSEISEVKRLMAASNKLILDLSKELKNTRLQLKELRTKTDLEALLTMREVAELLRISASLFEKEIKSRYIFWQKYSFLISDRKRVIKKKYVIDFINMQEAKNSLAKIS